MSPSSAIIISNDEEHEEEPDEVKLVSSDESTKSDEGSTDINLTPPASRPDRINVFMPYIPLEHFDNLTYAYINPHDANPTNIMHRAFQEEAGNPPFVLVTT
ncbi:hypothetical protein D1007_18760 [Hordeum vulgare]|nr:hypothetical protein D1007_18760 [Hordeum vulgare]